MTTNAVSDPVNEMLPLPKLATLGLQHVLVMYAGAVAVPLIIGGALKMSREEIAFLISADLLCCGLVSLIQCVGLWNVGVRLPIMMGVAFTAVAPIIATGSDPRLGVPAIFGAVIASGVFTYLAAPYMSRMVRFFPPVVTGTVVLLIGVSLMKIGINWAAGGVPMIHGPSGMVPNPQYGAPVNLGLAAFVLVTILLLTAFLKGFMANIAVLLGMTLGFVVAAAMGQVHFGGIAEAGWLRVVLPFHFGFPTFDALSIITLCLVMIVMMIESTGLFLAIAEINERPLTQNDLARGLRADGIGNIIGGIFGTFTYTSYAQNVGLVQVTGVRSRWVVAAASVILIVLSCLPKLSVLVAAIPNAVLGGAALVMFGMVAATGVKILAKVDFTGDRRNLYIVALGVGVGLIPVVADRFFAQLPDLAVRFFQNGILIGTLTAVLLNLLFNVRRPVLTPSVAALDA
ncbi:Uric acid transporter UacT [Variovorax sp. SRS16]|uniref:nucleobase:cation symporter-2 family protein n=1 Tax=Variovorax sp. SRS16 TaxID=282217 RepID=UPI001318C044|nr:nucleobase:cation symporter-2 family protein [Variovorax sp. SRS16]VTU15259.1 Uric acid transporter UacT [Variovorax sp. SRS16]